MRRSRLITAGLATAATLGLLLTGQPGNAAPDTTSDIGTQALEHMKVFQVQSRSGINSGNPDQAEALSIINASLNGFTFSQGTIQVFDLNGAPTATYTISNVTFEAWQQLVIHPTDYDPVLVRDQQSQTDTFDTGAANDAIEDNFTVVLTDTSGVSPVELDKLAAGSGTGLDPEGTAATPLSMATDQFNAAIRRDVMANDTDDNATDFLRLPALWGSHL